MRRREFITILGTAAALPLAVHAQQTARVRRVGWLSPGSGTSDENFLASFRDGLRELGWVVGQNIAIEPRWADGRFERLPDLAAELVRLKVDVIVANVTQASLAAKRATTTIPIVMVGVGDPLGSGLVDSLARPIIYRRFSAIHPLITLIGAIAGVNYFGLLGLLIGPLALSYFFELIRMYREEYLEPEASGAA